MLASDDNYASWMGVVIFSCLDKTPIPQRLDFYILDAGIASVTKTRLEELVASYQATITWLMPDKKIFQGFTIKRYGIATYYRLAVASLLPKHIDKVIYLDCDVLVADDVTKLWQVALDGKIIGAVENLGIAPRGLSIDRQSYFNAGILLIDLAAWRASDVETALFECMRTQNESLQYLDQDALNLTLRNQWKRLPLRWNLQPSAWSKVEKAKTIETGYSRHEFVEAIQQPGIIHFLAKSKPWKSVTFHPYKKAYLKCAAIIFPDAVGEIHTQSRDKVERILQIEKQLKNFLRSRKACPLTYKTPQSK